jgi:alkyl hydroperoxide reductase subunit AhpC
VYDRLRTHLDFNTNDERLKNLWNYLEPEEIEYLLRNNTVGIVNHLRIGDTAPDFEADTTHGKIKFHEFVDNAWCVLFSHPSDFTSVCTTELGMVEKLMPEFRARHVKCIALSCDSVEDHLKWIEDIIQTQKLHNVPDNLSFPIIDDKSRKISLLYGMLDPTDKDHELPLTVRSVFIVGPNKVIKFIVSYPATTGRNFNEILRVIDSLQLTAYFKVSTPANWHHGDHCFLNKSITDEQAKQLGYPKFKHIRPYMREISQPDIKHGACIIS